MKAKMIVVVLIAFAVLSSLSIFTRGSSPEEGSASDISMSPSESGGDPIYILEVVADENFQIRSDPGGVRFKIDSDGNIILAGDVFPDGHKTRNLGSEDLAWDKVFADNFVTMGSPSMSMFHDGTDGYFTTGTGKFIFVNENTLTKSILEISSQPGQEAHLHTNIDGTVHMLICDKPDRINFAHNVDHDIHIWDNDELNRTLYVHGQLNVNENVRITGTTSDSTQAALDVRDNENNSMLYVRNDNRVGIGTASPSTRLFVSGGKLGIENGTSSYGAFRFNDDSQRLEFSHDNGSTWAAVGTGGGAGAGGALGYAFLSMSVQQNDIAVNAIVQFDQISGTLSLNANKVTLLEGKTYSLMGQIRSLGIPPDGVGNQYVNFQWYDYTNNQALGRQSTNTSWVDTTPPPPSGNASATAAGAIVTPSSNIEVGLRKISGSGTGTDDIGNGSSWAIIQEIGVAVGGATLSHVRAANTSGQSIPNITDTVLINWTEEYDTTDSFDNATGVFTAPTTGKYLVTANLLFASNPTSVGKEYFVRVFKNGAVQTTGGIWSEVVLTAVKPIQVSTIVSATAGDNIEIKAFQSSGGARPLEGSSEWNSVSISQLPDTTGGLWSRSGDNVYYENGNVGIGTASPSVELEVVGSIRATSLQVDATAFYQVQGGDPTLAFDSNDYMAWDRSANQLNLVGGAVIWAYASSTLGWQAPSSRELKTNINELTEEELGNLTEVFMDTPLYSFERKDVLGVTEIGYIAEDSPDYISPDHYGIAPSRAVGFLSAVTRNQQLQIEALQAQIDALLERIEALELAISQG